MGCIGPLDPLCPLIAPLIPGLPSVGGAAGSLVTSMLQPMFEFLQREIAKAVVELMGTIATSWLQLPDPTLDQNSGPVGLLRANTMYLTAAVAVGAVLIAATRLALQRDGREAATLTRGIVWLVVLTAGGVPGVALLLWIGDQYSDWILKA